MSQEHDPRHPKSEGEALGGLTALQKGVAEGGLVRFASGTDSGQQIGPQVGETARPFPAMAPGPSSGWVSVLNITALPSCRLITVMTITP